MYRDTERMAGWAPTLLVTDADKTHHKAWEEEYWPYNDDWKQTSSHSHVRARWNINRMERFNGTMRTVLNRMKLRTQSRRCSKACASTTTMSARTAGSTN